MGFAKLDSGIINSSIWSEPLETRILWITFLAMSDENGFVASSRSGLNRAANITKDKFDAALITLESPDPESRTPDNEGRRVSAVEGGWIIQNFLKYRSRYEIIKEQTRERVKRFREKQQNETHGNVSNTLPSASASASASASEKEKGMQGGKEKTKYLDYVFLTAEEYSRLKKELGKKFLDACIFRLDAYLSNNRKKRRDYQDHNKVLRMWVIDEIRKKMTPEPEKEIPPPPAPPTPEEIAEGIEAKRVFDEQVKKLVEHVSI